MAPLRESVGVVIAVASSFLGSTAAGVSRYLVGSADALNAGGPARGHRLPDAAALTLLLRVRWPPRSDRPAVAGLGIGYFALFFILYNIALGLTTAARASLRSRPCRCRP
jgi:hypothetical protein